MNSKKFFANGAAFLGIQFIWVIGDRVIGVDSDLTWNAVSAFFIIWNVNHCLCADHEV